MTCFSYYHDKYSSNYFIFIPKLNYKNLISEKDVLNENKIYMLSDKKIIDKQYGNIVLAGHNNKYVFSNIYKLNIDDEVIISNFKKEYKYRVYETKYINVNNYIQSYCLVWKTIQLKINHCYTYTVNINHT